VLRRFLRQDKEKDKEKTEQAVKKTRQTWFGRMTTLFQRSHIDDELWDELEELLISADVGVVTTHKILDHLRERIREDHITQPDDALEALKREMVSILEVDKADDLFEVEELPLILLVVGVNGVGKTTSIAKLTQMFKEEGKSVVLGAADTFRAAAIEQLQAWGSRLEVDVIAHQSGADPGSVAFDTLHAAKSRNADVVIIDTAGRLHTKLNLMEELKKIQRVLSRQGGESQRVLLALDATTGQNGLFQARSFVSAVKCDGVFLAKLDGTAKGGIVLAITDELKLPVLYIGTGEQPDDIASFDPSEFVESLFATNARD
jgi:fused signal recognition particle receptor